MQASGSTGTGKRVRGAYYGAGIEKEIAMKRGAGVTHLEVSFDAMTGKAIDKYSKWFNNFTAHLVRENVSPIYFSWKNVPQTDIQIIYQKLSEKFHFPLDDAIIKDTMDRNMQRYYSEWLYAMKEHWRKSGGETNPEAAKTRPYNNVSPANWEELCNHWSSGPQQDISKRNKANRAKMSMLGRHDSKTIVAHFCEMAAQSGQPPSTIDTFEKLHRKQDGWLSEEVEKAHQEMVQRRASQSRHVVSSDQGDTTQFPADLDIVSDVLGSRSRHKKGFGSLPRLKAFGGKRARTSTSTFSTQQEHIERMKKEHGQLKQYATTQYEFLKEQTRDMNEIKKLFQQIQGLIPELNLPEHLLSTVRVPPPPPPPVIFDDATTSQPFNSVHDEDGDGDGDGDGNEDEVAENLD